MQPQDLVGQQGQLELSPKLALASVKQGSMMCTAKLLLTAPLFDFFSYKLSTQLCKRFPTEENTIYFQYLLLIHNHCGAKQKHVEELKKSVTDHLQARADRLKCQLEIFDGDAIEMRNRIIRQKITNKNQIVVVLGGSGTFQNISDAVLHRRDAMNDNQPMNIMWIPCGTHNDVFRSVGGDLSSPENTWLFVKEMLDRTVRFREIDLGVIEYTNEKYEQRRLAFNGYFAVGMATSIAKKSEFFSFLGKYKYSMGSTVGLITRDKPHFKKVRIDGEEQLDQTVDNLQVNIGQHSLGQRMAPFAQVDDQLLDVTILQGNVLSMGNVLKSIPFGSHVFTPQCKYYRAKTVELTLRPRRVMSFTVDGEHFRARDTLKISVSDDLVRIPFGHQY